MTAYFDDVARELHKLATENPLPSDYEAIRNIEHKMVFDCTVNSMFSEFPGDLREATQRTILLGGVSTQSEILNGTSHEADFETFLQHVERLRVLCSDLHTIAHEVAHREDCPFGDSPLSGVMGMFGDAEEIRDKMAAELIGTTVEAHLRKILEQG